MHNYSTEGEITVQRNVYIMVKQNGGSEAHGDMTKQVL